MPKFPESHHKSNPDSVLHEEMGRSAISPALLCVAPTFTNTFINKRRQKGTRQSCNHTQKAMCRQHVGTSSILLFLKYQTI